MNLRKKMIDDWWHWGVSASPRRSPWHTSLWFLGFAIPWHGWFFVGKNGELLTKVLGGGFSKMFSYLICIILYWFMCSFQFVFILYDLYADLKSNAGSADAYSRLVSIFLLCQTWLPTSNILVSHTNMFNEVWSQICLFFHDVFLFYVQHLLGPFKKTSSILKVLKGWKTSIHGFDILTSTSQHRSWGRAVC